MPDSDSKIKILLVEDEALIAEDEARQLEEAGYSVAVIHTGEKAIAFVRAHPTLADVILMDINLGKGMDGTRAAREILKEHDLPVIFLSVYTDRETVEKTALVSSYGYVLKTSGIAVLSASIRMAVNLHRALRELQTAGDERGEKREPEGTAAAGELLKAALDAAPDGIMIVDLDGRISWFNDPFVRMWGIPRETFEGKTKEEVQVFIANQLAQPERFENAIRQMMSNPEEASFERMRLKDGRVFERLSRPHLLAGRIVGRVCSFRDVTERLRMETALRDSEERYRIVSSITTDYFFRITLGVDGRAEMDMVSENFPSITGRTLKDVAQLDRWADFIHPDDFGRVQQLLLKLRTDGGEGELDCRSYVHGGQERWIHVVGRAVTPPGGARPSMIIGAVKDITERKRMEAELRDSHRLLDEAQTISKIGGWEYDVARKRIMWTDEVYRIYGVDRTLDINDVENDLSFYDPESRERVGRAFTEAVKDGKPYDLEARFTATDGTSKWVRTVGRPVVKDGRVVKVIGNIIDVTDRRLMEEELRRTVRQKEVLMKEVQHRVKNSLSVVSSLLGLDSESLPDGRSREIFANVRSRIQAISIIYDQMVRLNDPGNVDLRDLIVRIVDLIFKSYVSDPGRFALKTDLEEISLDTKRAVPLALIVNELIVNAVKYSHPAGETGEIRIGLHETDGRLELRVEDDGIGFPSGLDPEAGESPGLVLIRLLAGQLDGTLSFGRGRGVSVTLQFDRDRAV